jgi:hypothetical protein
VQQDDPVGLSVLVVAHPDAAELSVDGGIAMSIKGVRTAGALAAFGLLIAGCGSNAQSAKSAGSSAPSGTSVVTASASASAASSGALVAAASSAPAPNVPNAPVDPPGGPVPARFVPYSTTFVSANEGWVLGNAPCPKAPCTSIVRTRNGGRSWQGIPAPKAPLMPLNTTPPAGTVSTIRFADESNGWVAGDVLYATHNGGASWTQVPIGPSGGLITAIGTASGRVYSSKASCGYRSSASCTPTETVYSATIGSNSWSPMSSALPGSNAPALVVTSAGWYLPLSSGIYHGRAGAAPTKLPNPCPVTRGYGATAATIAVADSEHLDAICQQGAAAGSSQYQLYGTIDGGKHWSKSGGTHQEASGLYGLADNEHGVLLVATASGGSEIVRSTDDGVTLSYARINAASGGIAWADLGFTTGSQAVVVLVRTALYLSRDSGASWNIVSF